MAGKKLAKVVDYGVHEFGLSLGVKFQVYDYEPIEVGAYYKASGLPGESPAQLADRVAAIVKDELHKKVCDHVANIAQLRADAFEALAEVEDGDESKK